MTDFINFLFTTPEGGFIIGWILVPTGVGFLLTAKDKGTEE